MSYAPLQRYENSSGAYLSAQEAEIMALNFANRRLSEATSVSERRSALAINIKLWSMLLHGVQADASPLSPVLKQDLISVGTWSIRHSNLALNSGLSLAPLVDINQRMVEGLTRPAGPVPAAAAGRTAFSLMG